MSNAALTKAIDWVNEHVSDQTGKVFVVTGANSGLGLETTRLLAYKGATVIMACRNEERATKAIADLVNGVSEAQYREVPSPVRIKRENLDFIHLDLADLRSIEKFAKELEEKYKKVDCLICNAGSLISNKRRETAQGMEMQIGANAFGHYALVCQLAPLMQKSIEEGAQKPRIVFLSSMLHKLTNAIDFDDIDRKKTYYKWQVYCQTKLGILYLVQKFADIFPQFIVNSAHPGVGPTQIINDSLLFKGTKGIYSPAIQGCLPTIFAATDPNVQSKAYIGRTWYFYGTPAYGSISDCAKDKQAIDKFFTLCGERTKIQPPQL